MNIQNDFVSGLAAKKKRMDGRKFDAFRDISIDTAAIDKAAGSALVRMGKTTVIAGVKLDVGTPFSDKPDEGVLMTGAEFSPIASPDFELGPPSEPSIELARVVDRGIRESHAVDMKKLCIEKGEKVWMLFVDINILDNFGNLIDASALASAVALSKAVFPKYEDGSVVHNEKSKTKVPLKYHPIATTFHQVGNNMLLDCVRAEENASNARLTVTTRDDGNVVAMQKGGTGDMSVENVESALDISVEKGKALRKLIK